MTSPGFILGNLRFPNRTRTKRKVGNPTFAVIRRTCRFFPSVKVKEIQVSGIDFRTRIGGLRSGSEGISGKINA